MASTKDHDIQETVTVLVFILFLFFTLASILTYGNNPCSQTGWPSFMTATARSRQWRGKYEGCNWMTCVELLTQGLKSRSWTSSCMPAHSVQSIFVTCFNYSAWNKTKKQSWIENNTFIRFYIRAARAQWYSTGLWARRWRVRVPSGTENFPLHHCVQTGSGAHPASKDSFPEGKAAGAWSWLLTSI
jgi:hypothetical protein